jgi:hypothetical protein
VCSIDTEEYSADFSRNAKAEHTVEPKQPQWQPPPKFA